MRRIIHIYRCLLGAGALLSGVAMGHAEIHWLEKSYEFGLFKEAAGPTTGSVRFVNRGPEDVVVTDARPSCGCTSVEYPIEPVAPGDTARISFTYDPTGRPGKFDKSIRVYLGSGDMVRIGIRGNVLGTPESLSLFYPVEMGSLRVAEDLVEIGQQRQGSSRDYFVNVYNQSQDSIAPVLRSGSQELNAASSQSVLGPGDIAAFSFYLSSNPVPSVGKHHIPVEISDRRSGKVLGTVWYDTEVVPDTRNLSPKDVEQGPRCYLTPDPVDLGIISGDRMLEFRFLVQNQGKETMEVLSVEADKVLRLKKMPERVKPGKAVEAKGLVNVKEIPSGPFKLIITVYTNDPLHPTRTLSVAGIKE